MKSAKSIKESFEGLKKSVETFAGIVQNLSARSEPFMRTINRTKESFVTVSTKSELAAVFCILREEINDAEMDVGFSNIVVVNKGNLGILTAQYDDFDGEEVFQYFPVTGMDDDGTVTSDASACQSSEITVVINAAWRYLDAD